MKTLKSKAVRPTDSSVCPINLPFHPDGKVVARFDGGRLSSDAGLVCVWALDQQQRLTEDFAACIRDVRDGRLGTVKLTEAGCESPHRLQLSLNLEVEMSHSR